MMTIRNIAPPIKKKMVSFPSCKINLGLNIVAKRPDGYHNLVTCFYPVPWHDVLEIIPAAQFAFSDSGLTIPGNQHDNLCVRAFNLLKADHNIDPVHIHLHKIIPMGAGLGGGSADAAWTLRMLDQIFHLALTPEALAAYAAALGSDCAFFLHDKPMLGSGRGEILNDVAVDLKGKFIVLVKPAVHVATAEAYGGIIPKPAAHDLKQVLEKQPLEQWRMLVKNDFEDHIFRRYPVIAAVKDALYNHGALYASMSGSGATVYGIFQQPVRLEQKFPGALYWSGIL